VSLIREVQVPLRNPPGSAIIKVAPGKVLNENAAIIELSVRSSAVSSPQGAENILEWLDGAHEVLRASFERITSDTVKKLMGPVQEIATGRA
jgi:hypothetical protein